MATIEQEFKRVEAYTKVKAELDKLDMYFTNINYHWNKVNDTINEVINDIDNNESTVFNTDDYTTILELRNNTLLPIIDNINNMTINSFYNEA